MQNKLKFLLLLFVINSCKTYEKKLTIKQTNNARPISVYFKESLNETVISIPISFIVKNNTSEDKAFFNYSFAYSQTLKGSLGILYKNEKDTMYRVKFGKRNDLEKGKVYRYIYYSRHMMNSKNRIYEKKLKKLASTKERNREGKFVIDNIRKFQIMFPNYLSEQASQDKFELGLGKQNGKYEYLTLDVKY